jgi:predicted AlkP superfamily pyrophosphatase or phosphodiesterase
MKPRFPTNTPLLVLDLVGLRVGDLNEAKGLSQFAGEGSWAPLRTLLPAVTCTVQATVTTGRLPREHGIVANGWYHRDLSEIHFWKQSNALVQSKEIYDLGLEADSGFRCAKLFWWFNMYSSSALSVTPRPQYFANGFKVPELYSHPPELARTLQGRFGSFPFFHFWGPKAGLPSSEWIAEISGHILENERPDLALVYLPHLDYDHQRFGPDVPRSREAVKEIDRVATRLIERARARGYEVLVFSEYGIEAVEKPVFLNRILREKGFLQVQDTLHGELLDAGASRAFAVVDHQIAHIYLKKGGDRDRVAKILKESEGVSQVLDSEAKRDAGLDHPRSGELIALAERGAWFAYPYWLEETKRPDFAPTVDIHRKPGYDPAELFVDPKLVFPSFRVLRRVAQKKLGFRYLIDVIPTDPSLVRGSHGLLPKDQEVGPVVIATPGLRLPDAPRMENLLFTD